MKSLETRINALEQLGQTKGARPAVVLVIAETGITPEQKSAAAKAKRDGVEVIQIDCMDASLPR